MGLLMISREPGLRSARWTGWSWRRLGIGVLITEQRSYVTRLLSIISCLVVSLSSRVAGTLLPSEAHAPARQREVARFLRPGAPLVLIWNIESNGLGWYHAVREHYERIDMGSPQYYRMWWRKMFDVAEYRDSFDEAQEGTREWSLGMTEDQVGRLVRSGRNLAERCRSFPSTRARSFVSLVFRLAAWWNHRPARLAALYEELPD